MSNHLPLAQPALDHGSWPAEQTSRGRSFSEINAVVIVPLKAEAAFWQLLKGMPALGLTWVGWNIEDDPAIALAAYEAGARAVFPAGTPVEVMVGGGRFNSAVESRLRLAPDVAARVPFKRQLERGEHLVLPRESVVSVLDGVLIERSCRADGNLALLGFLGPGDVFVARSFDDSHIQFVAHTFVNLIVEPMDEASLRSNLAEQLAVRIQRMEDWSAMQICPHLEERLYHMFRILASSFGRVQREGVVVDLRLTHTLLASAIGANRTTVTRLIGNLRKRKLLTVISDGAEERFCLLDRGRFSLD